MTKRNSSLEDNAVGKRLRLAREARNVSLEAVGEVIGVSYQQVQKYEFGLNRIPVSRLTKAAKFLEVPVAYLATGESGASLGVKDATLLAPDEQRLLHVLRNISNSRVRRELFRHVIAVASAISADDEEQ